MKFSRHHSNSRIWRRSRKIKHKYPIFVGFMFPWQVYYYDLLADLLHHQRQLSATNKHTQQQARQYRSFLWGWSEDWESENGNIFYRHAFSFQIIFHFHDTRELVSCLLLSFRWGSSRFQGHARSESLVDVVENRLRRNILDCIREKRKKWNFKFSI